MAKLRTFLRFFTPIRLLVIGYAFTTLIIAALLTLPIASSKGVRQPFIDALFVATSGISTTGLTVVDIGSFYSLFGQIVLLIDFQIGGIGYMTFYVFLVYVFGMKLSLRMGLAGRESLQGASLAEGFAKFFTLVLIFTFSFEFIGAAILSSYWLRDFSVSHAIYLGIFHSVSAFSTAGFSPFPDSLMPYQDNITVNLVIDILSIIGGIGFYVLYDIFILTVKTIKRERPRQLSAHSKLAMLVTIIVLSIGTAVIFVSEEWPPSVILGDRLLLSSFQTISASTTDGFNTIDIAKMSHTSLFTLVVLMFIGASPGGTAGGIKTTTLGIMFVSLVSLFRGKSYVHIFKRAIPDETVHRSFVIFLSFVLVLIIDVAVLAAIENASFLEILFESTSALSNTGLSMGITPNLSIVGKIFLTIAMFIGRIGPLAIGFSLFGRPKPELLRYPEGEILVG
ncbi:MAG TPA: TrkH family potassium uptake protein [Candidatus Tripitaka californicus]|uniref:TrkH family potassium uptake protein n=4 Tax=Candidatus Tripitaka californicus TaxID=3367616 RepID=UPI004025EF08|nr:hypothetical protein [Planctomycetota bacterium]